MPASTLQLSSLIAAALAGLPLGVLLARNIAFPHLGVWPARGRARQVLVLSLYRGYCAALILSAGLAIWTDGPPAWPVWLGGAMVATASLALCAMAYRALGRAQIYGGTARLVTGGIYAWSRNPGYVASTLAAGGLAAAAGSAAVLGLAMGLGGLYWLMALNEERALGRVHGQAYADYMARTPRFLGFGLARAGRSSPARGRSQSEMR